MVAVVSYCHLGSMMILMGEEFNASKAIPKDES
jgi:hypothetical protein